MNGKREDAIKRLAMQMKAMPWLSLLAATIPWCWYTSMGDGFWGMYAIVLLLGAWLNSLVSDRRKNMVKQMADQPIPHDPIVADALVYVQTHPMRLKLALAFAVIFPGVPILVLGIGLLDSLFR